MLNIGDILKILPHRYPFLLVDRVLSYKVDETITAVKNVSMNEPQFTGHFPDKPIMPGVLIIEALAQVAGILIAKSIIADPAEKLIYFMAIDNAKFRQVVIPGDVMELQAEVVQRRGDVWKFNAKAMVERKITTEAVLTAMIRDR